MALQRRASPDTKLSPSAAIAILTALRDTSSGAAIVTLPAANVSTPALHLGHIHLFGDGTAPNTPEAIANYERAADVGDAEAQFALGVLHSKPALARRASSRSRRPSSTLRRRARSARSSRSGTATCSASTCRRRARRR